jgi:hypothetical protein
MITWDDVNIIWWRYIIRAVHGTVSCYQHTGHTELVDERRYKKSHCSGSVKEVQKKSDQY